MQGMVNICREDYERAKALQEAFDSFVRSRICEFANLE